MKLETKLGLMKHTDSYWTLLPPEIKEMILKNKESQELIEWRGRDWNRILCQRLEEHGRLRQKWFIGPIRCRCFRTRVCGNEYIRMEVYGHYWSQNGVKKTVFLHYSLEGALARCDYIKNDLWYQTNDHVQLLSL